MKILNEEVDFSPVEGNTSQSAANQQTNTKFYHEKKIAFSWSNEFWVIGGVQAEIERPLLGSSAEKSPTSDNGWVKWPVRFLCNLTFYVSKKVPDFMP